MLHLILPFSMLGLLESFSRITALLLYLSPTVPRQFHIYLHQSIEISNHYSLADTKRLSPWNSSLRFTERPMYSLPTRNIILCEVPFRNVMFRMSGEYFCKNCTFAAFPPLYHGVAVGLGEHVLVVTIGARVGLTAAITHAHPCVRPSLSGPSQIPQSRKTS